MVVYKITNQQLTFECKLSIFQALHPDSCKQNVRAALASFDETTSAALLSYFLARKDASQFLQQINTWWTISNSKKRYHIKNKISNAAVIGDQKTLFLRAFTDWLIMWQESRIPNCEKFHLSKQTSDGLIQTLRCHASLIEDLLESGLYEFVCTAKFQSDPIERRLFL